MSSFSVIIPALGEAANIGRTLDHLQRVAEGEKPQVIVVDGDAEGSTLAAVDEADYPGLRLTLTTGPRGRARQMNAGAALATGEHLLFLHADTLLPEGAFAHAARALAHAPAGAFDLGIASASPYMQLVSMVGRTRTRITRVPYGDQAIFLRRAYFEELGGFPELEIMEDVELMRRMGKRGDALAVLRPRVSTSARRWEEEGALYTTARNWALVTLYLLGMSTAKLAGYYRPHDKSQVKNRP